MREKFNISDDTFVFLYVGRFIHLKGIDLILRNFNEFKNSYKEKILVILVGGSEDVIIKNFGNFDNELFRIYSFKQKIKLVKYYIISDCLIFPTRQDVWGLVINEAIACNLPVAVSKYAGCTEDLIEDGVNGFIFNPLDSISFIETIKKCVFQKEELKLFKIKAKEKLKVYNHENAANNIVNFIFK